VERKIQQVVCYASDQAVRLTQPTASSSLTALKRVGISARISSRISSSWSKRRTQLEALLTNTKDGKIFDALPGIDYEGWFVKSKGGGMED
jgi:hypothetical protein